MKFVLIAAIVVSLWSSYGEAWSPTKMEVAQLPTDMERSYAGELSFSKRLVKKLTH